MLCFFFTNAVYNIACVVWALPFGEGCVRLICGSCLHDVATLAGRQCGCMKELCLGNEGVSEEPLGRFSTQFFFCLLKKGNLC